MSSLSLSFLHSFNVSWDLHPNDLLISGLAFRRIQAKINTILAVNFLLEFIPVSFDGGGGVFFFFFPFGLVFIFFLPCDFYL